MYFGLTLKEQARGALATSTQSTKPSTSRSLLFRVGAQMEQGFDQVAGRTQPRLDVPTLRTLFGATPRPGRKGTPAIMTGNHSKAPRGCRNQRSPSSTTVPPSPP
jgi:hypothetical protein